MPILAYVAIILVSLGAILFEVNWLTSPKLDPKAKVQVSTSAPPKVADETLPKIANATMTPRNVAPTVTMVPAASAPAVTKDTTTTQAASVVEPAAAPAIQSQQVPETTAKASTEFKREFTTDVKPVDAKSASSSSATFTPAAAAPAPTAAVSPAAVVASSNKTAQRAAAPVRDPGSEAATRRASKEAELRAVEREVRRITAREAALDDRGYDRRPGRSDVIMIERPDRDW